MALQKNNDSQEKKELDGLNNNDEYLLTTSIVNNTLVLTVRHMPSKSKYYGSFDSIALQHCGFSVQQTSNLHNICKFIESAQKRHHDHQLELTVSIGNACDEVDAFEGKVEANIMPTNNPNLKQSIVVVSIVKHDDFFPLHITMKLSSKQQSKVEILEDMIKDLQYENKQLNEKYQTLQETVNLLQGQHDKLMKSLEKNFVIGRLKPSAYNFALEAEIVSIKNIDDAIKASDGYIKEVLIADKTGAVIFLLTKTQNEDLNPQIGDVLWVGCCHIVMQTTDNDGFLQVASSGEITKLQRSLKNVNTNNNVSEITYEQLM